MGMTGKAWGNLKLRLNLTELTGRPYCNAGPMDGRARPIFSQASDVAGAVLTASLCSGESFSLASLSILNKGINLTGKLQHFLTRSIQDSDAKETCNVTTARDILDKKCIQVHQRYIPEQGREPSNVFTT